VTAGYLPHNTKSHAPFNLVCCVKVKRDVIAVPVRVLVLNLDGANAHFSGFARARTRKWWWLARFALVNILIAILSVFSQF
jgi:hypothetical protein